MINEKRKMYYNLTKLVKCEMETLLSNIDFNRPATVSTAIYGDGMKAILTVKCHSINDLGKLVFFASCNDISYKECGGLMLIFNVDLSETIPVLM